MSEKVEGDLETSEELLATGDGSQVLGNRPSETEADDDDTASRSKYRPPIRPADRVLQDHELAWWSCSLNPDAASPRNELCRRLQTRRNRRGQIRPTHPDALAAADIEFNKQFAVVLLDGDVVVFALAHDEGQNHRIIKPGAFHHAYVNLQYKVENARGMIESKQFTKRWWNSEGRRTHFRVTFDPYRYDLYPDTKVPLDADTLNLWNGFPIKPKKGNWSLLRRHIFEVICQRNIIWFMWLMCWIAHIVQYPHEKLGTAVVVRGHKGTGKTIVAEYISKLMPGNAISLSKQGQLLGRFNDHLMAKLFVTVEEAVWAGDKSAEGVLKDMITSPTQAIEGKFKGVITMPDYMRLWFSTNAEWAIPATWEERRYFVLQASDEHKQDHAWFASIAKQMSKGGLEAMMYDLQHLFIPLTINLRQPPHTPFLGEQVERTLESKEAWWYSCLTNGELSGSTATNVWPDKEPDGTDGNRHEDAISGFDKATGVRSVEAPGIEGGLRVPASDVWNSYQEWCKQNRVRYPDTEEQLGRFLADEVISANKSRPRITGSKRRPAVYDLAPIEQLRERFAVRYGMYFGEKFNARDISFWGLDDDDTPESDIDAWVSYAEGERGVPKA